MTMNTNIAYEMPSKTMPCYSYAAGEVNQHSIPMESWCYQALSCKFDASAWNPYSVNALMSSSSNNYVLDQHEDLC